MTPGPLALAGGDEFGPGNEPQDEILVAAAGSGPAFVLATAAAGERSDLAVANAVRWFARLGLTVQELPATSEEELRSRRNAEMARTGRFFYLVGGDPRLVPGLLAGTPVWDAVTSAWRDGASLAGSSAGAMGLGAWSLVPEGSGRAFTPGLGVVPNCVVIPHFEAFGRSWVDGALASVPAPDLVFVGIGERTAAVWQGAWRVLGEGAVTVISGGSRRRAVSGEPLPGLADPSIEPGP